MATSTLLEKIYINNPNALKEYLKAIETPIDLNYSSKPDEGTK